ncbi:cupin domain-containing protein [Mycobacterium sp. Marseille-P9652]|uniref:cupin domain-containing protein n=1 Tax=Mycobacterium sp. Marseille-P9652 TaxID=2654950 RepID=UPI0012E8CC81|nr:cupin domain-containing protein [Mycobacterium sp. Marseille-P9652]
MSGESRILMTGVDAAGRSCAVRNDAVELQGADGLGLLFSVLHAVPSIPAIAAGDGRAADFLDLAVAPGALRWTAIEYPPGAEFAPHHTDTIDFDVVLAGSVELILDDGAHTLTAGDSAVITGVDHGWRAGPNGCRLNVLTIGVAPTA